MSLPVCPPTWKNTFYLFSPTWANVRTCFKGSRQPESRGVRNVSICPDLSRTAAAMFFDFIYFRFRPSKEKWIGNVLPNRRNAAIRPMYFFFSFIMRIAYCLTESVCVLRQSAANFKKSPRNTNWKLKTLQYCCALPNGARCIIASIHRQQK